MDLAPARPGLALAHPRPGLRQPLPLPLALPRTRPDWPGTAPPHTGATDVARTAEVARRFETLIAAALLRSARAASLGDDGLGTTGTPVRDLVDRTRAEAIARAAPLGVARLLSRSAPLPERGGEDTAQRPRPGIGTFAPPPEPTPAR